MIEIFQIFYEEIQKKQIKDKKIDQIIHNFSCYPIFNEEELKDNPKIMDKLKDSKVIVVNQYSIDGQNDIFLIIGFNKTIIFIHNSLLKILIPFFSNHPDIPIYFLSGSESNFNIAITNKKMKCDNIFKCEINSFNQVFFFKPKFYQPIDSLWKAVLSCITGYLIKQAYSKIKEKQVNILLTQNDDFKESKFVEDDYIELRLIGIGSFSKIELIYLLEKEELCVIKKPQNDSDECDRLIKREKKKLLTNQFPIFTQIIWNS